ncbi:MAG: GntR family transcriptional regulator [Clostridia bacterium]|nr:GntR family transcriptional regulator [Clostridia bacterium]
MIVDNQSASLEEKVFLTLEEEILSGELKKGDSLAEIALSKRLGVSRTPIRGALHRLKEDGLVEITPNRGAVVLGIDKNDLIDIYKVRNRLEGLASASAAKNISPDILEELRESVELSEFYINRGDTEKVKELDTAFHQMIYRASGNRQLESILTELHRKIKTYRKLSLSVSGRVECSVSEHREILEAIEKGDAQLADTLTSCHIERALANVIFALDNEEN